MMVMSGVQVFIIWAVFTFVIGYVGWFAYNYLGLKELYFSSRKKKEIGIVKKVIVYYDFYYPGNIEEKVKAFVKYGVNDPVIIKLGNEQLKKKMEVKQNGYKISAEGNTARSGEQPGSDTARDYGVAGQRNIQERTPDSDKGASRYFS